MVTSNLSGQSTVRGIGFRNPTVAHALAHQPELSRMNILMVLTSHSELGDTGKKTGFWLEEFAAP